MEIIISKDKNELGLQAAKRGAQFIRVAIKENGSASIIVATGASQFEMLNILVKENIDWSAVTCFHLDEYIGQSETHPASFRNYLKVRFVDLVEPKEFHYINGENNTIEECQRLHDLITKHPIDVAFVGIGENAHLAFNDTPADFEIIDAYIKVELDLPCRKQQMGEGWFGSLAEVPTHAISMSVSQIMKSRHIICSVPDKRKADAVAKSVDGKVTPMAPASILQKHNSTFLYLDQESSSNLNTEDS